MFTKPNKEFSFAGFDFPKFVWMLPRGAKAERVKRMRNPVCGPYYHAPTPNQNNGQGFYLDSDGMMGLRWEWCDDVDGVSINHTGWYTDEFGDFDKIRGIVLRLPRGRGFLAGWSMGKGMASDVDATIYQDEQSAAYAADSMAEHAAEREREYQEEQNEEEED